MGFEPTNDGFANRCLRPLGYPALVLVAGAVYMSAATESREKSQEYENMHMCPKDFF